MKNKNQWRLAAIILHSRVSVIALCVVALSFSSTVFAQVIDPEVHIKRAGAQSSELGDDGRTMFYSYTERANLKRINGLEKSIEGLAKRVEVFQLCDQMRGSAKAKLIKDSGRSIDVAAVNYGYSGSIIACTLKYMHDNQVGTQLIFMKKASEGMFMVFVTD